MNLKWILIASPLLAALPCNAQSLADVLSSIQERKLAVEQSAQVSDHLPSVDGQQITVRQQTLIQWPGLGTTGFPTDQQVDSLSMDAKLALLNQAIMEFRSLQVLYVNLRQEDLDGSGRIGVIRPFLPDDFPDPGRADAANFHASLYAIARDVRRLSVLPWPIGGRQRTKEYRIDKWQSRVSDGNGGYTIKDNYASGSVQVAGWQPSSLGGGTVVSNGDHWSFTYAGSGGAWGYHLEESLELYARSDSNHYEGSQNGDYDLRILQVEKDTVFHTEAALFSKVPGRSDQIGGRVAVALRNEWTPVDMSKVSVTAPNSWDPGDAGFKVVLTQVDPSSNYSLGADPSISVDLDWVALGTPQEGPDDDWNDGIPFGYDATKAWLEGTSDWDDPDWLVSWEKQQGIGPDGIAGATTTLFRRQLHGLCAPTFQKGLDGAGKAANLNLAEKFSAPPAGDGKPLLHPAPGVLLGIPAGVGLDGSTAGFVGISPCENEAVGCYGILYPRWHWQRLTTRFDYAANLRFIGPAQDFHVVYATSRSESARGQDLPDDGPTSAQMEATGNVGFFDAWDVPRLRQVISRDLFIDITPLGHFKTQVKVYRRPQGAGAVNREPGKVATPPAAATPVRTIIFENPDAADAPYVDQPEKVRATDGTATYEVWRNGFPEYSSGNPDPGISFKMTDNGTVRLSKAISFPAVGQASINTQIDGNTASVETITDGDWLWHDGIVPASRSILSGGQTISIVNNFVGSPPGSQGGRYPSSSTVTIPDEPNLSLAWHDSGRLAGMSRGPWSATWSIEAGDLKAETKLNNSLVGTTWTTWTSGTRIVRVTAAPDGATLAKGAPACDWSEIEYGDATGTGLPGLPHRLTRKHASGNENGTMWTWTVNGGGSTTVEISNGLFSEGAVTRGIKAVVETNGRGYMTATRSYLLQGGAPLQIAGSTTPTGEFSPWDAPLKKADFTSGLESSWSFDGQKERLGTATDAFDNPTVFSAYDALDRPTGFMWKGHTGSASYNNGGFGVSTSLNLPGRNLARSLSWDARGRTTGGSVTAGGTSSFSLAHAANAKTLTTSNTVTGAAGTTNLRMDDGSLVDATGDSLAFGGLDGTALMVDDGTADPELTGLLRSKTSLGGMSAAFRTTWTDAWGRLRHVATTGTDNSNDDESRLLYSAPASTVKRVETRHASGRRFIEEVEPWAAGGVITRSGIDRNRNGTLDAGDRFVTTTTTIVGSIIRTTVSRTGNATPLLACDYNPSNGVTVTTLNGGEEVITETPDYGEKTGGIRHERGGVLVAKRDITLNHLGQATEDKVEGTGMAETKLNPTFRDDGSLASVSLTVGGATASATFAQNGTLSGFTHPLLGPLDVSHGFADGAENLTVNGTTATARLDGSASSLTGAGVMDRSRATTVSADGKWFEDLISPATGSPTSIIANPAGAKVLHDYAAGADRGMDWLAGGLPHSVSLGRGGATFMAYSNDGARDLVSITWPDASSDGFPDGLYYGGSVGFPERDAAGNITRVSDPSGLRSLDYQKNRLTTTAWLSGELSAYKVVRAYDDRGRLESAAVHRNGAAVHAIEPAYTGRSDEISGMSAAGFSAVVTRDAAGRHVTGFERGPVTQRWTRGTAGRITAADTNGTVNGAPAFNYTGFDTRGRRRTVVTGKGTWTYAYRGGADGDGQLVSATSTGIHLGNFAYGVDGIGRRDFGGNQLDPLNRFLAMQHPQAPRKLFLSADPDALLFAAQGVGAPAQLTPDADGAYVYEVNHPGAAGGWVPWHVRGVLEDEGDPGANPDAVAEFSGHLWFPPATENLTYDDDGNRESSSLWDYGWDGRNRLVRARTKTWDTAPEGWDIKFDYDAEGRRFRKTVTRYAAGEPVERKLIHFIWDGWDLLFERHEDGHGNPLLERRYVWGPDISGGAAGGAGGLLLFRETRGQTTADYYPLYDGTGHVVGLTNSAGNLVAEYWWGPFGELIEAKGAMAQANPWRYATKYYDAETGLYYFGHRYYDPVTAQWMNREPLGEDASLNLSIYCHNDPVNKVDVLGLEERVISGSAPVFFTVPGQDDYVYVGFPLEEDGWIRPFKPNGKHSIVPSKILKGRFLEANGYYSTAAAINRLRGIAECQLDLDYWLDAGFYLENGVQYVGGLAEMAFGVAAAPESAGVSLAATVHGFDVVNTARTKFAAGRGKDIQSGTSQILQLIPGVDRHKAEIGDGLISFATSGGTMYVLGKAPLVYVPRMVSPCAETIVTSSSGGAGLVFDINFAAKNGSSIARITPRSLPVAEEASLLKTLGHIDAGTTPTGPLAAKWGTPFKNWTSDLPGAKGAASPYLEYRVAPPAGTKGAGPLRIVVNKQTGEMYFTWTHYGDAGAPSFVQIR